MNCYSVFVHLELVLVNFVFVLYFPTFYIAFVRYSESV